MKENPKPLNEIDKARNGYRNLLRSCGVSPKDIQKQLNQVPDNRIKGLMEEVGKPESPKNNLADSIREFRDVTGES